MSSLIRLLTGISIEHGCHHALQLLQSPDLDTKLSSLGQDIIALNAELAWLDSLETGTKRVSEGSKMMW